MLICHIHSDIDRGFFCKKKSCNQRAANFQKCKQKILPNISMSIFLISEVQLESISRVYKLSVKFSRIFTTPQVSPSFTDCKAIIYGKRAKIINRGIKFDPVLAGFLLRYINTYRAESTADSETLTRGTLLCAENFKLDFYQSL